MKPSLVMIHPFAVYYTIFYRSRHANDEHCRRLIEKSRGKQMKRDPKGKDGAFHIDANTIPLGVRKLVKTGSPYDKGVMG